MPYPKKDEKKSDYISRCIPYVIKEGTAKDEKQAAAICYSMWEKHETSENIINKIDMILNEDTVESYIKKIKNKNKKQYAEALLKWFKNKQKGSKPDCKDYNLSTMGGQAVRLQLAEYGYEEK
jgi:hypothetical protein